MLYEPEVEGIGAVVVAEQFGDLPIVTGNRRRVGHFCEAAVLRV